MSEPAEVLPSTATALVRESDHHLPEDKLKLVDLEKGLKFFKGQCKVQIANNVILRQKAYNLLYNLYFKRGFTPKKESGLWVSIYDALPETTTFVTEDDQGCIEGALTVVFDSPIGLPADELYQKEIDEIRNCGGQICEFVSLGISDNVKSRLKILACLFYCAFVHAWRSKNSRELIITVHSRFEKFYQKNIFFDKIGPERTYTKVNGAPTVLLKLSLKKINRLRSTHRIFPFNLINYSDQIEFDLATKIASMVQPISDEEFYTFFIEKTDTWENALPLQKDFIKKVYPTDEINHNEVSRALARGLSKRNRFSGDTQNYTTETFQI